MTATLLCYIDFKSAAAYLAINPTLAFARRAGIPCEWRPYSSRYAAVPEQRVNETKRQTHVRVREEYRRRLHARYAKVQGLPLNFPPAGQRVNTDLALAGMLYCGNHTAYVERAYRAFWADGWDLNDAARVAAIIEAHGADPAGFEAAAWLRELHQSQDRAAAQGVIDTPMYMLEGEVFLGREHLPLIEARLNAD